MFKKIKTVLTYLFLIYAILGFFVLPLVLKTILIDMVEDQTNAKISMQRVYFNPFIFKMHIDDIKLVDAKQKHLLSLKSLSINAELYSILNSSIHLSEIELQKPVVSLVLNKDKTINLASILKEDNNSSKNKESNFKLPRIILDKIIIADASIDYKDYTTITPFFFSLNKMGLNIRDIDTNDFKKSDASIKFHTGLEDGGFFNLKSEIVGFEPLILKGSVGFEASKLYSHWKYLQDNLNLEVADGKINFNANYYLNIDDLNNMSIDDLNLAITKLRLKPKDRYKDVLNLGNFNILNASIKPIQKDIHIDSVVLDSLHLKVKRDKKANIDWLNYIKTNFTDDNRTVEKENKISSPWNITSDSIALKKISLELEDRAVNPSVKTDLNELNIYLKDISLKGEKPFMFRMDMRVNKEFICNSLGQVAHKNLNIDAYTRCSGLDIVKFRSYIDALARQNLSVYDVKLKKATLGFDANLSLRKDKQSIQADLKKANFYIKNLALTKSSTGEQLVSFSNFNISDLNLSTQKRTVDVKKTTLKGLNVDARLYENGSINIDNLIVAKKTKQIKTKAKQKELAYRFKLKRFELQSAKLSFYDKTISPKLKTKLDRTYINLYDIDSKEWTWLKYNLSTRLNSKGYIKASGTLRHTPLKQKGSLKLKKISLKEFSPYIEKDLYLKLSDGYVDLNSKVEYEKNEKKADFSIDGTLKISELFLHDSRDDSLLLSFNRVDIKSFEYEMFPDRAFINELGIDSFYVNAIIDREKKINFSSLSKVPMDKNTTKSTDANRTKFPFKIMKADITSGSAKFADLSLPLKFQTNIHSLSGVVYSISNQEGDVSYIDINGEVDKYGSTKLTGSVDSANPKLFTDLSFNFRNLDLNSLSGYSADFAGYKIDSGKLFLDLGYKIVNSQLVGGNSIVIKKIKLGEEIEDENRSSLPLGFVIALLENVDGIIDIDMPVEGNVDEPNFKYGALVWKTLGNLIVKAVASPFKFLGSMMGIDGDKLEYLLFEVGSSTLLPQEREKLDNIAKLMLKRPKISLKITPQYDAKQDLWMLKREKFIAMLVKESGAKNEKEQESAMNIELLQDMYKSMAPTKDASSIEKALAKKYEGKVLLQKHIKTLAKEITSMQDVGVNKLNELANKRASLIVEYLVKTKSIDSKRVFVKKIQILDNDEENWVRTKLEVDIK
ncbi:MAG: DUF748 domain-containing protein [Sulfurimonas sp.]|nr:DUF748 domain-containing protein [Sulfurimonas sp.]